MPGVHRDQKRVADSLKLGLWMIVSHPVGAGTEPGSLSRAVSTLNSQATSLVLEFLPRNIFILLLVEPTDVEFMDVEKCSSARKATLSLVYHR